MLLAIKSVLKPGGIFGIIDHNGAEGADNAKLHRIPEATVVAAATAAGFKVESSDVLANQEDDLTQVVFAPSLRGHTDRFLLKLTRP